MAYVNKSSLRTEFDAIKSQFDEFSAAGKVSPELGALFRALLTLFELMVSVFLEKTTKKDTKNSSLPLSQVDKDETSTQPGRQGKGLEQNGERFSNSRAHGQGQTESLRLFSPTTSYRSVLPHLELFANHGLSRL